MTITEFLEARIAEDEEQARDWQDDWNYSLEAAGNRLLAECAAKRAILDLADDELAAEVDRRDASALGASLMHGDIIRAVAAVYKDHPDYQQEWAL